MTVHAPFHFVPLSAFVFEHPMAKKISHDIPFREGLCGSFKVTIKAQTDILVGGKRTTENKVNVVNFFAVPGADGKPCYAIPESTIRGMIRNVLEIASFAQMRLTDDKRFGTMIGNTSSDHHDEKIVDLPTALFGIEASEDGKTPPGPRSGLKSRVNFGLAKITDKGKRPKEDLPVTVLGAPKPSYFPLYVRQPRNGGQLRGKTYATYTPFLPSPEPEVRLPELSGWKRYVAPEQPEQKVPPPPHRASNDVKIKLKPLPAETEFSTTVRFHNLLPWELGAVLWALEWGGEKTFRHRMGAGKPYGLGQVTITVDQGSDNIRPNEERVGTLSIADYRKSFVTEMEKAYGVWAKSNGHATCTWRESEQIRTLLAMADPKINVGDEYQNYMRLVIGGPNDFVIAKNASLALKPYLEETQFGNCADHVIARRNVPEQEQPEAPQDEQGEENTAVGQLTEQPRNVSRAKGANRNHRGPTRQATVMFKKGVTAIWNGEEVILEQDATIAIQKVWVRIKETNERQQVKTTSLKKPR